MKTHNSIARLKENFTGIGTGTGSPVGIHTRAVKHFSILNEIDDITSIKRANFIAKNLVFDIRKNYEAIVVPVIVDFSSYCPGYGIHWTGDVHMAIKRKGWWYQHIYDSWEEMLETWDVTCNRSILIEKVGFYV